MLIMLARMARGATSVWGTLYYSLLNRGYWNDTLVWRDNTNWAD